MNLPRTPHRALFEDPLRLEIRQNAPSRVCELLELMGTHDMDTQDRGSRRGVDKRVGYRHEHREFSS